MSTPAGSTIDRQVHVASQVLPAAGAFLTPEWQDIPKGTTRVTYWVTYTRGAAGGYLRSEAHYSNGSEDSREVIIDPTLVTSQPNGRLPLLLEQFEGPQPADGNAITYALTYEGLPAATRQVRLLVAEAGVTGTPGTVAVALTTDVEHDTAEARVR